MRRVAVTALGLVLRARSRARRGAVTLTLSKQRFLLLGSSRAGGADGRGKPASSCGRCAGGRRLDTAAPGCPRIRRVGRPDSRPRHSRTALLTSSRRTATRAGVRPLASACRRHSQRGSATCTENRVRARVRPHRRSNGCDGRTAAGRNVFTGTRAREDRRPRTSPRRITAVGQARQPARLRRASHPSPTDGPEVVGSWRRRGLHARSSRVRTGVDLVVETARPAPLAGHPRRTAS